MPDDVPLICDPPPGGFYVIECDEKLTHEQVQHMREVAEYAINAGKVLVLDRGIRIKRIAGRAEWPDAEFCAA